jgi:protein involved in polysaccharide export with SLBB domain
MKHVVHLIAGLALIAVALFLSVLPTGAQTVTNETSGSVDPQAKSAQVQETVAPMGNAGPNAGGIRTTNEVDILKTQDEVHVTFADLPVPLQPIDDQVKQDGTITLLFNHTFQVAGKTRKDVEKEIHDFYVPNYYRNMTVTLQIVPYVNGNRQIYIGRPMSATGAIISAGGFTDFARKKTGVSAPYDGGRPIEKAIKAAKRDGQRVLVQSCAQGCSWCLICERLMTTNPEIVAKIKRDFVYVVVDTTDDTNREFYKKYAGGTDHTLVLVVLDADGKELTQSIGFDIVQPDPAHPGGYHIAPEHIMKFLNKWAAK